MNLSPTKPGHTLIKHFKNLPSQNFYDIVLDLNYKFYMKV